jgi:hypothetical protein
VRPVARKKVPMVIDLMLIGNGGMFLVVMTLKMPQIVMTGDEYI